MAQVVVTGTWTVVWDAEDYRKEWGEELTDEQILAECTASAEQDWLEYARSPDTMNVFGELVA